MHSQNIPHLPDDLTLDYLDQITIPKPTQPDIVAVRLGLLCTLYVQHPQDPAVRQALAECGDQYQAMFGAHLTLYLNPTGNGRFARYPKGGVSLAEYVANNKETPDDFFTPSFTSGASFRDASSYSMKIWAPSERYLSVGDEPAYFSATLPFAFLKDRPGQGAFQRLVHGWCRILKPYCGYAGIGVSFAKTHPTCIFNHFLRPPAARIDDATLRLRRSQSPVRTPVAASLSAPAHLCTRINVFWNCGSKRSNCSKCDVDDFRRERLHDPG